MAPDRLKNKLGQELGDVLETALKDPQVTEIMLNPDGKIWIEKHGEEMKVAGEMPEGQAMMILSTVASSLDKVINKESPILEGVFPLYSCRFSGQIPPVVDGPCFTIRKPASQIFTLAQYYDSGIVSVKQLEIIQKAVTARSNILIVGSTSSGKTTLANAILDCMVRDNPNHRLIILEDTREIQCSAPNKVQMQTAQGVDLITLARANLRMRPTRIIVGEVRGGEALSLLKTWNTGHPGGLATIHANSAYSGLTRMEQLILEVSKSPMQTLIGEAIDLVIFIQKTNEGRKVSEIIKVKEFSNGFYQTQTVI